MSVRDTSIQVYYRIKEDGTLSKRRWEVYDIVFNHGPLTANEIFQYTKLSNLTGYRHNVHSRLCELREMGVLQELGTKECSISGETVILWDVTSNYPKKLEKKKSAKQIIYELTIEIAQLKRENAILKSLIEERNPNPQGAQQMLF